MTQDTSIDINNFVIPLSVLHNDGKVFSLSEIQLKYFLATLDVNQYHSTKPGLADGNYIPLCLL